MKPELQGLCRVQWQLFCTFTLRGETVPERHLAAMFFSLVRETASNFGVHFKQLIWCLRRESGERTHRRHLHALIAGLPAYAITPRVCRATESIWERLGGGWAVVRVFDSTLAGTDYILKGLEQAQRSYDLQGANLYEFQKFGGRSDLTLSESLIRVVMGRRQLAKRGRSSTTQSGVNPTPDPAQVETRAPVGMSSKDDRLQGCSFTNGLNVPAEHVRWIGGYSGDKAAAILPVVTSTAPSVLT